MALLIFVDESGDLGWSFDAPYGNHGSSRFLTISALILPESLNHYPERVIRQLYKRFDWNPKKEKKWVDMPTVARTAFAQAAAGLCQKYPQIQYHAIVVAKQNVQPHIRRDPNKLYNFMLKVMLADEMAKHDHVTLLPDPRSIKVESGNSLHDYLETTLWFECGVKTKLETLKCSSHHSLNLQFADMLAGVIQSSYELKRHADWHLLRPHVKWQTLYFNTPISLNCK